jgi:hypothetical protein
VGVVLPNNGLGVLLDALPNSVGVDEALDAVFPLQLS